MTTRLFLSFAAAAAGLAIAQQQPHPLASRTLVVYSSTSSSSATLAAYYKAARGIPDANMCAITPPDDTSNSITQAQFISSFKTPIQACITAVGQANLLYVVMAYIANLRFTHASNGMEYSIDSFLADAFDTLGSTFVTYAQVNGSIANPPTPGFYAATESRAGTWPIRTTLEAWRAANPSVKLYSVWRLDGDTPQLAQGLIDQAVAAEAAGGPAGAVCADLSFDYGSSGGNPVANGLGYTYGAPTMVEWDVYRMATHFQDAHWTDVSIELTPQEFGEGAVPACSGAAAYVGWYGGAGSHRGTYSWVPGAIGVHIDSYSLGNFRAPFNTGTWAYQELKNGLAVTSGSIAEQYTLGSTRGAGLFRDLLAGARVGDAFLRNTPWSTRWMLVQVGDPLYAPWALDPQIKVVQALVKGSGTLKGTAVLR